MKESEVKKIIEEYEQIFGDLPHIPLMANYAPIAMEMKEAIIRKKPLTDDELIELFEDIPVDQGDADVDKLIK